MAAAQKRSGALLGRIIENMMPEQKCAKEVACEVDQLGPQ